MLADLRSMLAGNTLKEQSKFPEVKGIDATLDYVIKNDASLIRFGDGEINLLAGYSIPYQDYDEELGLALAVGSDVSINVPIVGLEACGTSFMKDLANLKMLISTADGGVADISPAPCLEVSGANYNDELKSLYLQMNRAGQIFKDDYLLEKQIRKQLKGYIPVVSGSRMIKDYLRLIFGK